MLAKILRDDIGEYQQLELTSLQLLPGNIARNKEEKDLRRACEKFETERRAKIRNICCYQENIYYTQYILQYKIQLCNHRACKSAAQKLERLPLSRFYNLTKRLKMSEEAVKEASLDRYYYFISR